jgi:hypothetical protein
MSTPIKNIRAERIVGELDATEISISGSLSGFFSGSFTGSLEGTASFAQTASIAQTSLGSFASSFDGQGSVVLENTSTQFTTPRSGTITGWSVLADGTFPTCSLDIWVTGSASNSLPTSASSIVGGDYPSISGSAVNYVRSTDLTTWTSSFEANDIFVVNIVSCSVATKVNLQLEVIYT